MITIKVKRSGIKEDLEQNYDISYAINNKVTMGGVVNSKESAKYTIKAILLKEDNYDIDSEELDFILNNVDNIGSWEIIIERKE